MCTFIKGLKWVSFLLFTVTCLFAVEANTDKYNNQGQQKAPHPDQEKNNFYNQLHEAHATNFDGPQLWERITVAPSDGSRDGVVDATICSDTWSSETYWILLDTQNWWAWGADGWTQHTAGSNSCEDWSATVPAGNYLFIVGDSYGDGGGSADVSVNGDYVGTVTTASGDALSPYSNLYEASLGFDVTDAPAGGTSTVNFEIDTPDDCAFVTLTGTWDGWSG